LLRTGRKSRRGQTRAFSAVSETAADFPPSVAAIPDLKPLPRRLTEVPPAVEEQEEKAGARLPAFRWLNRMGCFCCDDSYIYGNYKYIKCGDSTKFGASEWGKRREIRLTKGAMEQSFSLRLFGGRKRSRTRADRPKGRPLRGPPQKAVPRRGKPAADTETGGPLAYRDDGLSVGEKEWRRAGSAAPFGRTDYASKS
jgi:hypothetical protein